MALNLALIISLGSSQLTQMLSTHTSRSFLCLLPSNGGDAGAGEGREARRSDHVSSSIPRELLCFAVCHFRPLRAPSSLLMLLCIFQLNFLHKKERGTLNPLALVIMQMLRGVDCPSLHIINVSGYEWRVCYFSSPFVLEWGGLEVQRG